MLCKVQKSLKRRKQQGILVTLLTKKVSSVAWFCDPQLQSLGLKIERER